MTKLNGRPSKYNDEQAKNIAIGFLEAKRREPWLTQSEYAREHGISCRTLRRFIKLHGELTEIRLKIDLLESRKRSLVIKNIEEEPSTEEKRGGLIVAWD